MPFNAIPAENFLNRGYELDYLQGLSELKGNALGGNVFLEGPRGMGKTELLKQLYRVLFWEGRVVPFYYSFQTANLKGTYFAKDYFTRFVRQYLAFVKKEPSIADHAAEPLLRLVPTISSLGLYWLIDCIENFQEHVHKNDLYWQIVSAISVPVIAAQKSAKSVIVMLDDFDAAANLYESSRGDAQGLTSLFGESMRHRGCPHVITGAAGALEPLFTDHSLIGMTERMSLGPLPGDLADKLFRTHLANLKVVPATEAQFPFLDTLRGNPLYIRNLAKTARKMQKTQLTDRDLVECYSLDVSEGETAFYWASVLNRHFQSRTETEAMLKIFMHASAGAKKVTGQKLTWVSGVDGEVGEAVLDKMALSGILRDHDAVLRDFLQGRYLREVEGQTVAEVREKIAAQYLNEAGGSCFELVIPMNENAELVVAKAVEQIGRNMNLDPDFLNRLQIALIEVCINAMEHSGSYEKKVFLKFITRPDRLEIVVENSGRPFSVDLQAGPSVEEKLQAGKKRGWGFKLVHAVMDSVKVERINDRTRVVLVKNIQA